MAQQDKHFEVTTLQDGRRNVKVTHPSGYVSSYTTVKNIDGSNRFMADNGLWDFMPYEYEQTVARLFGTALAA